MRRSLFQYSIADVLIVTTVVAITLCLMVPSKSERVELDMTICGLWEDDDTMVCLFPDQSYIVSVGSKTQTGCGWLVCAGHGHVAQTIELRGCPFVVGITNDRLCVRRRDRGVSETAPVSLLLKKMSVTGLYRHGEPHGRWAMRVVGEVMDCGWLIYADGQVVDFICANGERDVASLNLVRLCRQLP